MFRNWENSLTELEPLPPPDVIAHAHTSSAQLLLKPIESLFLKMISDIEKSIRDFNRHLIISFSLCAMLFPLSAMLSALFPLTGFLLMTNNKCKYSCNNYGSNRNTSHYFHSQSSLSCGVM